MDEVAMFIDFENLRYGLLNDYGQEPNFSYLVKKAKKYGRPSMMRAYADFAEHPSELNRQIQVAGIEAIHIPVKRSTYTKGTEKIERVKNAADMVLALDAITEALEADMASKVKAFLVVTGDRDYVRLVTMLKNKFGQRVIICGVPGSVSSDLEAAAGETDHIEIEKPIPVDMQKLKSAIVKMVHRGPSPLKYWTPRIIDQWSQSGKHSIPGTAKERRDAIHELLDEGILKRQERDDPQKGRITEVVLVEEKAQKSKLLD
ncbi:MAG: NYN domain-containing protein [Chloroflexi bacterium]|nr:NYN domain-containing protein [Chloroflexota bacterium]